MLKQRGGIGAD